MVTGFHPWRCTLRSNQRQQAVRVRREKSIAWTTSCAPMRRREISDLGCTATARRRPLPTFRRRLVPAMVEPPCGGRKLLVGNDLRHAPGVPANALGRAATTVLSVCLGSPVRARGLGPDAPAIRVERSSPATALRPTHTRICTAGPLHRKQSPGRWQSDRWPIRRAIHRLAFAGSILTRLFMPPASRANHRLGGTASLKPISRRTDHRHRLEKNFSFPGLARLRKPSQCP